MKKLILLPILVLLLSLQSCIVSQQPKMAFFDNPYYDFKDTKFTSINVPLWIAKPFVKKALKEDGESNEEVIALIKKIKKVKILTVENGEKQMLTDFSNYLNTNNYEEWITIKHDGKNVNIKAKQDGDLIKKLMLTVNEEKEMVFIDVTGNFSPDDISKIINYSDKTACVTKKTPVSGN